MLSLNHRGQPEEVKMRFKSHVIYGAPFGKKLKIAPLTTGRVLQFPINKKKLLDNGLKDAVDYLEMGYTWEEIALIHNLREF